MSELTFRKAERRKARLRMGLAGPSGSGKTLSSLLIAYGITGDWSKIGLIDTENHSGELYVGTEVGGVKVGEYNVLTIDAPYTPERYITGIKAAEQAGLQVLIIDSLSHAWAGQGGILEIKDAATAADPRGNSYTAWRNVTPRHNQLVESILTSGLNIIATMRSKTDYIQTTDERGKTVVRKVGLAPIQRDGMEYEFTIFAELDPSHNLIASKDRTHLLEGLLTVPTPLLGQQLKAWLETGVDEEPAIPSRAQEQAAASQRKVNALTPKADKPEETAQPVYKCADCSAEISEAAAKYSKTHYGRPLCYNHQKLESSKPVEKVTE
jgi:nucleoside-triphosphatase THEP1